MGRLIATARKTTASLAPRPQLPVKYARKSAWRPSDYFQFQNSQSDEDEDDDGDGDDDDDGEHDSDDDEHDTDDSHRHDDTDDEVDSDDEGARATTSKVWDIVLYVNGRISRSILVGTRSFVQNASDHNLNRVLRWIGAVFNDALVCGGLPHARPDQRTPRCPAHWQ